MTIKQALKQKKKLDKKIKNVATRMMEYNTIQSHNIRHYSSKESMGKYLQLIDELVVLKTAIYRASMPVIDTKFKMDKLKYLVYTLRDMGCVEGVWKDELNYKNKTVYASEITLTERDKLIEQYEAETEKLGEVLEEFYGKTEIQPHPCASLRE